MDISWTLVGIGEALFDVFPAGRRLGGAPLNMAVAAHALGAATGGGGVVVSRVGQDEPGRALRRALEGWGMASDWLQSDPDLPTGRVEVNVGAGGEPDYTIAEPAAWDALQYDPDLQTLARQVRGVGFGTLAQRGGQTRNTLYRFLGEARGAIRLFDVNLRGGCWDRRRLVRSFELATVAKLNEAELAEVAGLFSLGGQEAGGEAGTAALGQRLRARYGLERVAVTRGARGTLLLDEAGAHEGEPIHFEPAPGADPVGAGDACTAGLLVGLLRRMPAEAVVTLANAAGAWVASRPGAIPEAWPDAVLDRCQ